MIRFFFFFLGWGLCLLFLLQSPADPRTLVCTWVVLAEVVGGGGRLSRTQTWLPYGEQQTPPAASRTPRCPAVLQLPQSFLPGVAGTAGLRAQSSGLRGHRGRGREPRPLEGKGLPNAEVLRTGKPLCVPSSSRGRGRGGQCHSQRGPGGSWSPAWQGTWHRHEHCGWCPKETGVRRGQLWVCARRGASELELPSPGLACPPGLPGSTEPLPGERAFGRRWAQPIPTLSAELPGDTLLGLLDIRWLSRWSQPPLLPEPSPNCWRSGRSEGRLWVLQGPWEEVRADLSILPSLTS